MKLSKALKEKKRLAAEIAHLKNLINSKNSYLEGSNVPEKFDVKELYGKLQGKIQDLVNLKIVINEANRDIQPMIYLLGEYKAMISFLSILNVQEGVVPASYNRGENTFEVQFDELKREEMLKEYQDKADALQDEIDTYNYTTDVMWKDDDNLALVDDEEKEEK
jgi:hypothetical protein